MNNYGGALWEISINQEVDNMPAIHAALEMADIEFNADEAAATQHLDSIYVNPDHLTKAVKIINRFGYTTDEDDE